ncbi:3'-5' exonuclease [Streptomyces sp. NPDC050095]|uniref:3'-5' exonuclease n=1 Tax=unclassified Streptomyces TaxID=2593676 RepID=UPI003429C1F3
MTSLTAPGRLADDPVYGACLFVVIDFEGTTPAGAPPEPTEVAALALRHRPGRGPWPTGWQFQALIKPPAHAVITEADVRQTGITPAMVATAPPAREMLHRLETTLPITDGEDGGGVLLVAHHASVEANFLDRYRTACPRLARTRLIDTRLLARHLLPDAPSYTLDALLHAAGIGRPADRHRALPDVAVTAELFAHLLTVAASTRHVRCMADLLRIAARTPRSARPTQLSLTHS